MRGWGAKLVLALMGLSFAGVLLIGLGAGEPALAAGPRFDPPLLPGLDVVRAQEIRDCVTPLFMPKNCGWWM